MYVNDVVLIVCVKGHEVCEPSHTQRTLFDNLQWKSKQVPKHARCQSLCDSQTCQYMATNEIE